MAESDVPADITIRNTVENWIFVARGLIFLFGLSGLIGGLGIAFRKSCDSVSTFGACTSESFSYENAAWGFWIGAAVLLVVALAMTFLEYLRWKMAATSASLLLTAESLESIDDD